MSSRLLACAFAMALTTTTAWAVDWTSVQSVVDAAVANNPTIHRLQSELAAARERVAPAGAQPNPMLMAGLKDKQIDLRDDAMMTMYMVGASQTFERPSKRDARRTAAELEAQAIELEIAAMRAEIARDARFAWSDLAATDSQISSIEQVREIVNAITDAARVRYEIGTSAQAEVLRAQLERSELDHQLIVLRGRRAAVVARLLPQLGLPASTSVDRIALPHETAAAEIEGSTTPSPEHPAIAALEAQVALQEQMIRLARLETKPDFNVEATYGHRRVERDVFSVVGTIELPLRRKTTIDPRVRDAIALRDAAKFRTEELRRSLSQDLASAAAVHHSANEQIAFHERVLVPQARMAVESALTSYQSGRGTFDSVLAAQATYLRLQIDYYEFLATHIKAIADFEALRNGARAGAIAGSMP
jgi:outer membrane protein, heavy metal efflux system